MPSPGWIGPRRALKTDFCSPSTAIAIASSRLRARLIPEAAADFTHWRLRISEPLILLRQSTRQTPMRSDEGGAPRRQLWDPRSFRFRRRPSRIKVRPGRRQAGGALDAPGRHRLVDADRPGLEA